MTVSATGYALFFRSLCKKPGNEFNNQLGLHTQTEPLLSLIKMSDQTETHHIIQDCSYEGERPLFALKNAWLKNVCIHAGESALKHVQDIQVTGSRLMGKYPFWHSERVKITDTTFTVDARAAIWYTHNLRMSGCTVDAPKMFRRVAGLSVESSRFSHAAETLWNCREVKLHHVDFNEADYIFMNGVSIEIHHMDLQGNYSFQDAKNITIRNSRLASRDAFWGAEDVTVFDSVLDGEYLGWHSKNLRLVNCTIRGTQPLCYATDLVMENCRMENTDLCFEYSTVKADISSDILSVRNPNGGSIRAPHIGEVILDENCLAPGRCKIETVCVGMK